MTKPKNKEPPPAYRSRIDLKFDEYDLVVYKQYKVEQPKQAEPIDYTNLVMT